MTTISKQQYRQIFNDRLNAYNWILRVANETQINSIVNDIRRDMNRQYIITD